jgi:hypothetical protein
MPAQIVIYVRQAHQTNGKIDNDLNYYNRLILFLLFIFYIEHNNGSDIIEQ